MGKRGKQFAEEVEALAVKLLDDPQLTIKTVRLRLKSNFSTWADSAIPTEKTLRTWRTDRRKVSGSPWQPKGAPEDGFVLEAFAQAAHKLGQLTLSEALGDEVAKVARLAPSLPPLAAWHFAREYVAAAPRTEHLDVALGFARLIHKIAETAMGRPVLGLDREQVHSHVDLHRLRWLDRPLCAYAGDGGTLTAYLIEMGLPTKPGQDEDLERFYAEHPATYDTEVWFVRSLIFKSSEKEETRK
jgi:hypothetical protein